MDLPSSTGALIVGAGPIGLACAISASRRGIPTLVIDAGCIANSIANYPPGMTFFTTAERLEIGGHPFTCVGSRPSREEALAYYRGIIRAEQLAVRTGVRLTGLEQAGNGLKARVTTVGGARTITAQRVVIATGYFDHPNLLDVPGESLPHVRHWFEEPHRTSGEDIVIVGGKNSAIEAALLAFRAGARVTLVHRAAAFKPTVKYWLLPDFENRVAAGEITARMSARVRSITSTSVEIEHGDGRLEQLPAGRVYLLIGYHPDFELLERIGIALEPATGRGLLDRETLETNIAGVHLAGSVAAGRLTSEVFIENGRFDGEKIFGDAESRDRAAELYAASPRPVGE